MKTYLLLAVVCCALLFSSCVKDIDFDQTENVVLEPVFEADFVYTKLNVTDYIDPDMNPLDFGFVSVADTLKYGLLSSEFAIDNMDRIELVFKFENTVEREVKFIIQFMNDSNQTLGSTYEIVAKAGNGEEKKAVVTTELISLDHQTLVRLSTATKIRSVIQADNVNATLRGLLELRSKAIYYIKFQS